LVTTIVPILEVTLTVFKAFWNSLAQDSAKRAALLKVDFYSTVLVSKPLSRRFTLSSNELPVVQYTCGSFFQLSNQKG
jgi:hypothetical protein